MKWGTTNQSIINLCGTCPPAQRSPCIKREYPCHAVMAWADGNKPLKEYLAGLDMERYPNQDYKQVLIDQQEAKRQSRHNKKRPLNDFERFDANPRLMAVALLLNTRRMKIWQIALAFNVTERTIRRLKKAGDLE